MAAIGGQSVTAGDEALYFLDTLAELLIERRIAACGGVGFADCGRGFQAVQGQVEGFPRLVQVAYVPLHVKRNL